MENISKLLPIEAVIFVGCIIGIVLSLLVVYQCLKRGICCQVKAPNISPDEDDSSRETMLPLLSNVGGFVGSTPADVVDEKTAQSEIDTIRGVFFDARPLGNPTIHQKNIDPEIDIPAGRLLVSLEYSQRACQLNVTIQKADCLPPKERGGGKTVMLSLTVVPEKRQRFKTQPRSYERAYYDKLFRFTHIGERQLTDSCLRIRAYGKQPIIPPRIQGEIVIHLNQIDPLSHMTDHLKWYDFQPMGKVKEYLDRDSDSDA